MDEFSFLSDRIERLQPGVGDVRDRLRNCVQVANRPQDSLALARSVAESIAKRLVEGVGLSPPATLDACLRELETPAVMSRGLVPAEIITILHMTRVMGNKAIHDSMRLNPTKGDVQLVLQSILRVVEWYFSSFERGPKLDHLFAANAGAPAENTAPPKSYFTRRQEVYAALWTLIEEAHFKIRTEAITEEALSHLTRHMNAYILKHSAYLDGEMHELANTYLVLLIEVRRLVMEEGDKQAVEDFRDTRSIPVETLQRARKLGELWKRCEEVRSDLLARVQRVLAEEPQKKPWWRIW